METLTSTPARRSRLTATFAAAAALLSAFVLAGCSPAPTAAGDDILTENGLTGMDAAAIIEQLDQQPVSERPTDLIASVQPKALVLTDDRGREAQLPMPEGEVYISVAPFQEQTHECHFHSLTTCRGELANADIDLTVVDSAGKTLVDESRQTYDNGFVGFWVPAGIDATVTVAHEGREGSATISTVNPDDPTCITTLQLA